jgi:uncharacterized protein (TIGR02266 family)
MLPAFSPEESPTNAARRRRSSAVHQDRRQGRRLPIELDVTLEGAAHRFTAQTRDLSEGGMFVMTELPIPIGTHVMMSFTLRGENATTLEVLGVVQWVRSGHEHHEEESRPPGLGIAFFCLEPEAKGTIERFCAVRHALY